jgi:hypothetical protein
MHIPPSFLHDLNAKMCIILLFVFYDVPLSCISIVENNLQFLLQQYKAETGTTSPYDYKSL